MYAGALSACRKINGSPFYFNIKSNAVVDLLSFVARPIKAIESIEPFFALNGRNLKIAKDGRWEGIPDIDIPGRRELMKWLAQRPGALAGRYRALVNESDVKLHRGQMTPEGFVPFDVQDKDFEASIDKYGMAHLSVYGRTWNFAHFPGFAKFITGGWFEEWVYWSLKPLVDARKIFDLRIGFEVAFEAEVRSRRSFEKHTEDRSYQELDVTFTDGSRLYVVECKAGKVTSEHVMKLENIVGTYGGVGGRGILAACFEPDDETVKKRLNESRACRLVFGRDLAQQIEDIIKEDRKAYFQT